MTDDIYGAMDQALEEDEAVANSEACNVQAIYPTRNASADWLFVVPAECPETTMAVLMRGAGGRVSGLDPRHGQGGGGAYVAAEITVHGGDAFRLNVGHPDALNGEAFSYLYPASTTLSQSTVLVLAASGGAGGSFDGPAGSAPGFDLAGIQRCGDGGGGDAPGQPCVVVDLETGIVHAIAGGAAGSAANPVTPTTKGESPNCADPGNPLPCGGDGYGGGPFRGGISQFGGRAGYGGQGYVGGAAGASFHTYQGDFTFGNYRSAGAGGGGGASFVRTDSAEFPILRSVKLPGQGREPGFANHPALGIAGRGAPTPESVPYPHIGQGGIIVLRLGTKVTDDDFEPLTVSVSDATVNEGNAGTVNAEFVVTLSKPSATPVTVQYATSPGTATAGTDYIAIAQGTLTFEPLQVSKTLLVPVKGDKKDEPDETFSLELSSPTNASLGNARGTGTIADDDTPSVFSIANVTVTEGAANKTISFTIRRAGAIIQPASVHYTTLDGTATAGSDYLATSGVLTLGINERQKTVAITIVGDLAIEATETFSMRLSNPHNATIGVATATATITDDDVPGISIDDVAIEEGDAGTRQAIFTLTLSTPSTQITKVTFTTIADSATAGNDYVTKSVIVTIPAGTLSKTVPVTINGDVKIEADESFRAKLSAPVRLRIDRGTGTGTILNDDP